MFYAWLLLVGCTALAYLSVNRQYAEADRLPTENNKNQIFGISTIAFIALLTTLVCFSGLRTYVNDTTAYILSYENRIPAELSEIQNIDWALGANPLFVSFQIILKAVFSANAQMFLFISSLITVTLMVVFIRKYADNFGFSIFIFLAFAVYAFTLPAIKQSMATAIGIWAVPFHLNGKRFRAVLLIAIALMVHPYVIVLCAFVFLQKNVWDKRAVIIIALTVFFGMTFTTVLSGVLNLTSLIGDEYDIASFEGSGINIYRVIVYWVTPVLSYVFRNEIRERNDKFLNICVNLSFVSACFVSLAMFGGAIALGRLANYMDLFTCISLPLILSLGFSKTSLKPIVNIFAVAGFCVFYLTYYNKIYTNFFGEMFSDYYYHVPITELFRG